MADEVREPYKAVAERFMNACDEANAEIDRLHSWEGLLSLIDEHWPTDSFDGSSGDPGPRIIALTREIERLRAIPDHWVQVGWVWPHITFSQEGFMTRHDGWFFMPNDGEPHEREGIRPCFAWDD